MGGTPKCYHGGGPFNVVMFSTFYDLYLLPIRFKVSMGVSKWLAGLIGRIFWRGTGAGKGMDRTLIIWDVVCSPLHSGGLGLLHNQGINLALLTRWLGRIRSPKEDLAIKILKDFYGTCPDLERCAMPVHGASAFWLGLLQVFPHVLNTFLPI